ncbi:SLC13 family permease [Paraburkholderia sp. BL10I2N1]|uniref:SLC13 family permease n=1 Tax=Paraburkholderia sp. BL10I2N1 TaxID=1938796 RepID=UPI00105E78DF|nr:SLC13 family permease [Paraburkholderia sp. BL10I2N1]TDN57800.1 putative tyrosine transporter P-protein [Paraburkholderia sp. BL10I2N1]
MSQLQIYITVAVFAAVILLIAFNLLDMAIAALTGTCILIALGILDEQDLLGATRAAAGPLGLLFGGMVVARILATTGLFDVIGDVYLRATGGSGARFLLMLIALVAPVCALLPNATTVILLAPVIVRVCIALEADFVRPMLLAAIISNSAGLLTIVGDPATFLVGSTIGMTFGEYLRRVSLGGLVAVLVIVPLLPVLMRDLWTLKRTLPPRAPAKRIERPVYAALAGVVLFVMMALFVFGEDLPTHIVPPAVAMIASALALLVGFAARVEPTDNVLRDVDWKTLVFLASIFCLVQAVVKTGLLQLLAVQLYQVFGGQLTLVALMLLAGVGLLSSLLANVPVAAASIIMVKGYLVMAEVVPDTALSSGFSEWPTVSIPVFIGLMFGATLGGNATLVGAAANIVAAGVCARQGTPITFGTFLRYGLPITVVQLAASAVYVLAVTRLLH